MPALLARHIFQRHWCLSMFPVPCWLLFRHPWLPGMQALHSWLLRFAAGFQRLQCMLCGHLQLHAKCFHMPVMWTWKLHPTAGVHILPALRDWKVRSGLVCLFDLFIMCARNLFKCGGSSHQRNLPTLRPRHLRQTAGVLHMPALRGWQVRPGLVGLFNLSIMPSRNLFKCFGGSYQ